MESTGSDDCQLPWPSSHGRPAHVGAAAAAADQTPIVQRVPLQVLACKRHGMRWVHSAPIFGRELGSLGASQASAAPNLMHEHSASVSPHQCSEQYAVQVRTATILNAATGEGGNATPKRCVCALQECLHSGERMYLAQLE